MLAYRSSSAAMLLGTPIFWDRGFAPKGFPIGMQDKKLVWPMLYYVV